MDGQAAGAMSSGSAVAAGGAMPTSEDVTRITALVQEHSAPIGTLRDAVARRSKASLSSEDVDAICDVVNAEAWVLIDKLIAELTAKHGQKTFVGARASPFSIPAPDLIKVIDWVPINKGVGIKIPLVSNCLVTTCINIADEKRGLAAVVTDNHCLHRVEHSSSGIDVAFVPSRHKRRQRKGHQGCENRHHNEDFD